MTGSAKDNERNYHQVMGGHPGQADKAQIADRKGGVHRSLCGHSQRGDAGYRDQLPAALA